MSKIEAQIATLKTRIAADTIKLAELEKQLGSAALLDAVAAGFTVSFKVGRAETRREVSGLVTGRGLVKDVDSVRVEVGEGFDKELFTIKVSDLLSVSEPVSQPSEAAVLLGTAAAGVSEAPVDEVLDGLVG